MDLPMFYDEADEWSNALLLYDAALKEINTKLEILNNEFKLAHQYNPIEHITSRIKSPQSIAKKLRHSEHELNVENIVKYVNDVAGIRIICSFTSDIYRIADLITKQNDIKILKIKDYIMCPKPNGYTSYHMIVTIPVFLSDRTVDTKVEIQIRTIAMDFWASLEHKIYYKFEGNAPENIRKELKECSDIVNYLDQKMLTLNEEIRDFTNNRLEGYHEEVTCAYKTVVAESFGTIVEEEEIKKEVHDIPKEIRIDHLKEDLNENLKKNLSENFKENLSENFSKNLKENLNENPIDNLSENLRESIKDVLNEEVKEKQEEEAETTEKSDTSKPGRKRILFGLRG